MEVFFFFFQACLSTKGNQDPIQAICNNTKDSAFQLLNKHSEACPGFFVWCANCLKAITSSPSLSFGWLFKGCSGAHPPEPAGNLLAAQPHTKGPNSGSPQVEPAAPRPSRRGNNSPGGINPSQAAARGGSAGTSLLRAAARAGICGKCCCCCHPPPRARLRRGRPWRGEGWAPPLKMKRV